LKLDAGHVVVGQQQAVRTDERTRTAIVQAHARPADMMSHWGVGVKLYFCRSS
jgi:hypothetical protein